MRVRVRLGEGRCVAIVGMDGRVQFISEDVAEHGLAWIKTGRGPSAWELVRSRFRVTFLPYRRAAHRPHRLTRLPYLRLVQPPLGNRIMQAVIDLQARWKASLKEKTA